jgi:hypothetical protein
MNLAKINTSEFAGYVADPIYSKTLSDGSFDKNSEILDYNFCIRYEEFIMLLVDQVQKLKTKVNLLESKL